MAPPNPPAGTRPKAEPRERAGAIVVDRNRATGKRLARILVSAGYTVKTYEDVTAPLVPAMQGEPGVSLWLIVGESAAAGNLLTLTSAAQGLHPQRRCYTVLYGSADELDVPMLCEQPGVVATLGQRPSSGRLDLESELLGIACHLRGPFCRSRPTFYGAPRRSAPASPTSTVAMPPKRASSSCAPST